MKLFFTTILGLAILVSGQSRAAEDYRIVIKDHKFIPEVLEIPSGEKIKLVISNEDASAEEFESYELNREKIIQGGSEGFVFIGPLKPGEYPFFGEFNPDTAQGRIVVKE